MTAYVIVGGGIVGASVAYHLAKRTDEPITLFDRGRPGRETTAKSVAHFGFYGTETLHRMKRYGMELYNEFFEEPRGAVRFSFRGMFLAATEATNAARLRRAVEGRSDEDVGYLGIGLDRDPVEYVPGSDLDSKLLLPPVATDRIAGGLFRPHVGYLVPPRELAYEFLDRARELGVTVRSDTEIEGLCSEGSQVTGVVTAEGERVPATETICAAGPWNVEVAGLAGVDLPVRHSLDPVLELRPERPLQYDLPAIKHYESPFTAHLRTSEEILVSHNSGTGYEDGRRYDPDEVGDEVPPEVRTGAMRFLDDLLPGTPAVERVDEWVGVTSLTPDGRPIAGPTGVQGFSVAALHSSGIQLAPAIGRLVASQAVDGRSSPVAESVSPRRFSAE